MAKDSGSRHRTSHAGRGAGKAEVLARKQIVSEAARIMAEDGVRDFQMAKRKAARRLGMNETRNMPTNQEIDEAMRGYVELFHADLPQTLSRLRSLALEGMRLLAPFNPRLVGPVLSGVVTKYTEIQLHVTVDEFEELLFFFQEHDIPVEQGEKRVRLGGNRYVSVPSLRFSLEDVNIEVLVFGAAEFRESPLNPVDGKPTQRATIKEVEELLRSL